MNAAEKKELLKEFEEFLDTKTAVEIKSEYKIGDVIEFTLSTGEEVSAMAMRQEEDGMLFVFVDCLTDEQPMFKTTRGKKVDYLHSDLRQKLNGEILESFPDSVKSRMKEMQNGDKMRLLMKEEVFGDKALEPMKAIRNRIAFQGNGTDRWEWWWLQDKIEDTASDFARVTFNGNADFTDASHSVGVRPAFKI